MQSAAHDADDSTIAGINVTPFVDISLVLLIIFMVTAKVIITQPSIPVDLPRRSSPGPTGPINRTVQILIDATGTVLVDARPITLADLRSQVEARRVLDPELRAVIAADPRVSHGRVVQVIDTVRVAGVTRFAIQTEAPSQVVSQGQ